MAPPAVEFDGSSSSSKRVCVMDAGGCLGSALVRRLHQRGYFVHAAIQSHVEMQSMERIFGDTKNLRVFHTDPLDYHSIVEALEGCCGLFYSFEPPSDHPSYDESMAEMEVRAAHNVLEACAQTDTIDKVVFTSSATAVIWRDRSDSTPSSPDFDERNWSDVNFCKKFEAMSFPHVIKGKSCIIADQSGSGKTLAYLLPVVQSIRQDELEGRAKSLPQSPRVVILVPTAELASQVLRYCRLMSKSGVPFRSMIATGGFRQKTQLENLRNELDVLIATPGRFLYLVQEGFLQLTSLKCAVLDEVDILFKDEDFQPALQSLMNLSPVTAQYLFVTATLPVNVYNKLVENFPDCEVIMGPGMHRTSSGLEEILVDCSGEDGLEKTQETAFLNKKSALLKIAEEGPVTKMIIFCNKIETCRKVENALRRLNRKVLPFHAALAQDLRVANMEEFCQSRLEDGSLFLVCTDRASRGIDIPGVDQVVLFDFPRDPSEYVRRVGRTARGAGGKGRAFVFVVGKQVSLARRIIERNRKGHPLHDVPSNI